MVVVDNLPVILKKRLCWFCGRKRRQKRFLYFNIDIELWFRVYGLGRETPSSLSLERSPKLSPLLAGYDRPLGNYVCNMRELAFILCMGKIFHHFLYKCLRFKV